MKGQVKWFSLKKGYGFIKGEDEKDYFFHYTSMPHGVLLKEEDAVNFETVETEKGLQARDITLGEGSITVTKETESTESKASTEESLSETAEEPIESVVEESPEPKPSQIEDSNLQKEGESSVDTPVKESEKGE